ncbi:hypothetical protein GTU75_07140 [Erysipelothrix rhusiopathiae]|nr:hypothetical protein [Erysipelothrix rhusiopathiae]
MNHNVLKDITRVNRTNQFIYYLRSIKPLRKVIYANIYEKTDQKKKLGRVVSVFHFIRIVVNQFVYLFIVFGLIAKIFPSVPIAFIWLLLVLLGCCINTISTDDSKEKWTLIRSFKVDYQSYYMFRMRNDFIERMLYAIVMMSTVLMYNQSFWIALMMGLFVMASKIIAEGIDLTYFDRYHEKIKGSYKIGFMLVLTLSVGGLYLLNLLSDHLFVIVTCITVVGAIGFIIRNPFNASDIHEAYGLTMLQRTRPDESLAEINLKTTQETLRIDDDYNLERSNRVLNHQEGYSLLNRLFLERHRRLWFKPLRFRFVIILAAMLLSIVVLWGMRILFPNEFIDVSKTLSTEIFKSIGPYIFVVYLLNIGESMTRAYYLNCDSKLLNYAFYRRPEIIWKQFLGRLGTLVTLNLIPLLPIILGVVFMVSVQFIVPVRGEVMMFILTLILLSIFFSVHNLLMYYTLQPYNESMQEKGILYNLMKILVVMVAYNGNRLSSVPNLNIWLSIITTVYFVLGVFCVRMFSGKTFKIRK